MMPPESDPARFSSPVLPDSGSLQDWREADDTAREAERRLYAAWHAYLSSGSSVPALLQQHATMARAHAARKLRAAVAARRAAAAVIRSPACPLA